MKKFLTFLIVLFFWAVNLSAQINLYTFASSLGTYTPLSTETILWSASFDDENSTAITIPNFTVNGTDYTTMFVQANGWISLGGTSISSNYSPISATASYPVVISAFGRAYLCPFVPAANKTAAAEAAIPITNVYIGAFICCIIS